MSSKVNFSNQTLWILVDELVQIEPDVQWTTDEFVEQAHIESWNLDEYSDEGYMALKHMLLRLTVPKEKWGTIKRDEYLELLKEKYLQTLALEP